MPSELWFSTMVPVWVPVDPMQGKTGQKVKKKMNHEKSFAELEIIFFRSRFEEIRF